MGFEHLRVCVLGITCHMHRHTHFIVSNTMQGQAKDKAESTLKRGGMSEGRQSMPSFTVDFRVM